MRRWAGLASALVFGVAASAPAVATAQSPLEDAVTGTAVTGVGRFVTQFTFDAHSGPSGESPRGLVTLRLPAVPVDLPGVVTCLNVSHNRASIVFRLSPEQELSAGGVITVEGNGAGQDKLDWNFVETLPSTCPVPSTVSQPVTSGDITIVDAEPRPTSKDQCKNGGWVHFGFENQGDCVRFVRHGARQACLFEKVAHGTPAFRAKYGRGPYQVHAMRRCIRQRIGP